MTAAHTCLARNRTGRIQTIGAHACQRSRCASTAERAGTRHAPAACVPEVRHYGWVGAHAYAEHIKDERPTKW